MPDATLADALSLSQVPSGGKAGDTGRLSGGPDDRFGHHVGRERANLPDIGGARITSALVRVLLVTL